MDEERGVEVLTLERATAGRKVLAVATVRLRGITLRLRVVEGRTGLFVNAPAHRTEGGAWEAAYTLDAQDYLAVRNAVVSAYTRKAALWAL